MRVLLVSLSIKNFGLFKEAHVNFDEKFNILTGESGAGKSMFISAIKALTTGNVPSNMKRDDGSISAYFTVENVKDILNKYIELEDNELVISANFSLKKTLFRINGTIVPKSTIKNVGKYLIELHSQDSNVIFRDSSYQNKLIFNILKKNFPNDFKEYNELFNKYLELNKKLKRLPSDPSEIYRKIDVLKYQIDEIKAINPKVGEDDELTEKFNALNNVEDIKKNIYENLSILKDSEINTYNLFGDVVYNINKILDYGFTDEANLALSIQEEINELYGMLESKLLDLDVDKDELQLISEKLNSIIELKRKYGPTLEDVVGKYESMKKEALEYQELQKIMDKIKPEIEILKEKMEVESKRIIDKSMKYLKDLKLNIEKNLKDLNMVHAEIDFYFEKKKEPDATSFYSCELLLKTIPQGDFLKLSKVASGGEMSRILLAIEEVIGNNHYVDTMLFDEVDSGVGPRMADVVGKKLSELSSKKQIITITHMPQVANFGTRHFKIQKIKKDSSIYSNIVELKNSNREKEIKDMYGDIVY